MVLLNIFRPSFFNEDPDGVFNAFLNPNNSYEYIGSDSDANDRDLGPTFAFNYFRLGEALDEQPNSDVQRRIVIVNGSTSELLFSLTPVGSSSVVIEDILEEAQTIINAINSVQLTPKIPDDLSIEISSLQFGEESITLQFESAEELTGFSIMATTDFSNEFTINLTDNAVITETSPGEYQAVIDNSNLPDALFMYVQL